LPHHRVCPSVASTESTTKQEYTVPLPGTAKHPTTGSPPPRTARHWRPDIAASLVVFLVALPLSLGIATASGAPIMAGLIAAVIGGIVAGSLGGSPLQVSGPAAGLTVIVAGLINQF